MRRREALQPWAREESRVRVLLECDPEFSPSIVASVIERGGFAVRTCEGPGDNDCDLLVNGACTLVEGADVVVNMLGTRSVGRNILDEVAGLRRPPAVVAEMTHPEVLAATEPSADTEGIDLDRITVVETPVTGDSLIEAINTAIKRRSQPVPWWGDGSG